MPASPRPGTPGEVRPGGRHQGRARHGPQRARARARHLGRRRVLRAAGPVDRRRGHRLAGVVGRAPREPARGPVGAPARPSAGKAQRDRSCSTTTWAGSRPSDHPSLPADPRLQGRFAKRWGMSVAVGDLHRVIAAARRRGGQVVLGGHSLGGASSPPTPPGTSRGAPGADELAGLVYIDGGSFRSAERRACPPGAARRSTPRGSPWLAFGGIPAPFAGLFSATGSLAALIDPDSPLGRPGVRAADAFDLTPSVPVTNLAQYGYALNVKTSPASLIAAQAHLGAASRQRSGPRLGRRRRTDADHPLRDDVLRRGGRRRRHRVVLPGAPDDRRRRRSATASRTRRSACSGSSATMGRRLPRRLQIYAFGARLGGAACSSTRARWPPSRTSRRATCPDQPGEHVRPQRPGRRVPTERVRRRPDAFPPARPVAPAHSPRPACRTCQSRRRRHTVASCARM